MVIEIADLPVHPPWERDSWLMQELARLNYSSKDLRQLNCVQLHQEVLFLSNVMDASGQRWTEGTLDKDYGVKNGPSFHS